MHLDIINETFIINMAGLSQMWLGQFPSWEAAGGTQGLAAAVKLHGLWLQAPRDKGPPHSYSQDEIPRAAPASAQMPGTPVCFLSQEVDKGEQALKGQNSLGHSCKHPGNRG